MEIKDVMKLLEEMKVGVFATVDSDGNPLTHHARTAANEEGIFFMTSPDTSRMGG